MCYDQLLQSKLKLMYLYYSFAAGRDAKGFRNVVNPTNPSREVTQFNYSMKKMSSYAVNYILKSSCYVYISVERRGKTVT